MPDAENQDNAPLNEGGMKALKAERDARQAAEDARKAAEKALADAKAEFEQKSAKLAADIKAAQDAKAASELSAARSSVFRAKSVPAELEEFVSGSTADELAASADKVLAAFHPVGLTYDPTLGASGEPVNNKNTSPEAELLRSIGLSE